MSDDTPDRVADYMGRDTQHNDGERWRLCVCTRCGLLLTPFHTQGGWCHCEPTDFEDERRTYRVIDVIPASRADALAEDMKAWRESLWDEVHRIDGPRKSELVKLGKQLDMFLWIDTPEGDKG